MSLQLMYITNNTNVARIAEKNGVNKIMVDLEYIGKDLRQSGMDTVQSHHTLEDITNIRNTISSASLLVRCNPIHNASDSYVDSISEINSIIARGADYIMLPYFKTYEEVEKFITIVNGRVQTVLLFETPESIKEIDKILEIKGINEVFIGLNDLSLGYHKNFMFELLADGTVEEVSLKFRKKQIPFGFGGIAAVGSGMLPAEMIIREHYRLHSQSTILSRSFCNTDKVKNYTEIEKIFKTGIKNIRKVEEECNDYVKFFDENTAHIIDITKQIAERKQRMIQNANR